MNRNQTSAYNHGYDTAVVYMNTVIVPQRERKSHFHGFVRGFAVGVGLAVIVMFTVAV